MSEIENASQDKVLQEETLVEPEKTVESITEETMPVTEINTDSSDEEKPKVDYHSLSKEELLDAMRSILKENRMQAHKEVSLIKQCLFSIRQKEIDEELKTFLDAGNEPAAFSARPCVIEEEFKELHADFKEKRAAFLEAEENRRQENLAKKLDVLERIRALMDDVDNINKNYTQFIELQTEFKSIKDIPAQAESDVWKQFKQQEEQFYDLLKLNRELRDLDFKKNLEIKKQLIEQAKALGVEEDVVEAGRKLQILHNEWRETGPVAKEIREELWNEFKEASTVVNKRHQEYFEQRRAKEQEFEAEKTKLCEEVEAIDYDTIRTFSDWDKKTEIIKNLQAKWRELGPASRKANVELFARFRKSCDEFFEKKYNYYKTIKQEHKENLIKKEALCSKAEELLSKVGESGLHEKIQALQAEWKTIGPVDKKNSDAIWERFTKACNAFYDALCQQRNGRREEESANLEAKKALIEKIKAIPLDGEKVDILSAVRELQDEWKQIGFVPFKVKESLYKEYREACDAVYNSLDSTRTRERMNDYKERIRNIRTGGKGVVATEREKLQAALERKKNDLATYENNMGFFNVKTSAGNSMVQDLERKIKKIEGEISEIEEKIKLLDQDAVNE